MKSYATQRKWGHHEGNTQGKNRKCERRENNYGKEKKGDINMKEEYIKEQETKLEEQE